MTRSVTKSGVGDFRESNYRLRLASSRSAAHMRKLGFAQGESASLAPPRLFEDWRGGVQDQISAKEPDFAEFWGSCPSRNGTCFLVERFRGGLRRYHRGLELSGRE